jgi:hypothetical protein
MEGKLILYYTGNCWYSPSCQGILLGSACIFIFRGDFLNSFSSTQKKKVITFEGQMVTIGTLYLQQMLSFNVVARDAAFISCSRRCRYHRVVIHKSLCSRAHEVIEFMDCIAMLKR